MERQRRGEKHEFISITGKLSKELVFTDGKGNFSQKKLEALIEELLSSWATRLLLMS